LPVYEFSSGLNKKSKFLALYFWLVFLQALFFVLGNNWNLFFIVRALPKSYFRGTTLSNNRQESINKQVSFFYKRLLQTDPYLQELLIEVLGELMSPTLGLHSR
jgi:hypothetical protein